MDMAQTVQDLMYSRATTCDQNAGVHPSDPLINIKEVLLNNIAKKRKPDECFQTPAKKAFTPETLSPDMGCYMDYFSPPDRQNSASPLSTSKPALRTEATEMKQTVHLHTEPDFDGDVDSILCLNPSAGPSGRSFDNPEECKSPRSNKFQKALLITEEHKQEMEREDDRGYLSLSISPQLKEPHSESSSLLSCHKRAALSGSDNSFTINDLDPIVSGPLLPSVSSTVEHLKDDVDVWDIGLPIFESSLCHNLTVKCNAAGERSIEVSEEVRGGMEEPFPVCQATLGEEEASLDTSYETTLPLNVKVKSVVVPVSQLRSGSKPASPLLPTKQSPKASRVYQTHQCVNSARSQRPVNLDREVDLERYKRLYFHSVSRHLNENSGAGQAQCQDVMKELLNLMTHVADQARGPNGTQWQHPSDLTSRNYQRRFGNMMPTMALHEWQAKNCKMHKRFAKVQTIFKRSPFP
ncbi:uncharacterized protein [Pagrus major]|uniref:uncharacterized protein n=1 Tax=Pagrus major TaxID=143350 RepID=UPI003CC84AD1